MKGYIIGIFLFFLNFISMNYLHTFTNLDVVTFYWYEIIILSFLSKLICCYSDKNFYYYTMLLVNKNQSMWTNDYCKTMLSPSHFLFLLLTEYCANADREYIFVVNNWYKNICNKVNILILLLLFYFNYNIFTNIIILNQLVSKYNINIIILLVLLCSYIYSFKFILLSQLIETIFYIYNYNKQIVSNGVNVISDEFKLGYFYHKRPMMIFNTIYVIIPLYIIVFY